MPGNYPGWGMPMKPMGAPSPALQAMYDRPLAQRPAIHARPRRTALRPWMLVIGALVMAILAFAVTRACIHTATRPPAETR